MLCVCCQTIQLQVGRPQALKIIGPLAKSRARATSGGSGVAPLIAPALDFFWALADAHVPVELAYANQLGKHAPLA